jgi:hypothetical protein
MPDLVANMAGALVLYVYQLSSSALLRLLKEEARTWCETAPSAADREKLEKKFVQAPSNRRSTTPPQTDEDVGLK